MSDDKIPETIGELYIYVKGEFKDVRTTINQQKMWYTWVAGITGAVISALVIGVFKLAGFIG